MNLDIEAEQAVLGAVLLSETVLPWVVADEHLRPEHFGRDRHAAIYGVMLALSERGEPVDEKTVSIELDRTGLARKFEGLASDVAVLAGAVPNVANVRAYARRVVELARWRRVASAAVILGEAAQLEDESGVARAETLLQLEQRTDDRASLDVEVFEYLAKEGEAGVPWPFRRLGDLAKGGMQRGETTLVGGWTNIGKTVLLDTMLQHAADQGAAVRLYINEGSRTQRALRSIARTTGIPYSALRSRRLDPEQKKLVIRALETGIGFEVVQAADWSAADIARDMRWHPRDLVAVDILHEIAHDNERELAAIWQTLKAASTSTGAHLIATVHLNEERAKADKPPAPTPRDIRGSGMLKNGADNVLFVHREHKMVDGHAEMQNDGMVWFAKSRHGEHGGLKVRFDPGRMRFIQPI